MGFGQRLPATRGNGWRGRGRRVTRVTGAGKLGHAGRVYCRWCGPGGRGHGADLGQRKIPLTRARAAHVQLHAIFLTRWTGAPCRGGSRRACDPPRRCLRAQHQRLNLWRCWKAFGCRRLVDSGGAVETGGRAVRDQTTGVRPHAVAISLPEGRGPLHALTEPVIPPRANACSPILWGFRCALGTYWPSGVVADSLPKID